MKHIPIWPFIISTLVWVGILIALFALLGCQTASATLDAAGNIRGHIAEREMDLHVRGLCGSNFDKIRERFGKNDQDWNAILNVCESGLPLSSASLNDESLRHLSK